MDTEISFTSKQIYVFNFKNKDFWLIDNQDISKATFIFSTRFGRLRYIKHKKG